MTCRKEHYRDMGKWLKTTNAQKLRYYGKRAKPPKRWELWEDELVLAHEMTDTELSHIVNHGVKAIQIRRCRLNKWRDIKNERID